jgi:hypothetical protein
VVISAEILQMDASARRRLRPLIAFFKPEASPSAADALRRLSAPGRGPISAEFSVIKTHLSRGFLRNARQIERLTLLT